MTLAFLILMPDRDTRPLETCLLNLDPDLALQTWPHVPRPEAIQFAVTWKHPPGELCRYPNLRAASSYGAGIDHFLADPQLPPGLVVGRVVTPQLIRDMTRFVLAAVLGRQKNLAAYRAQQARCHWAPLDEPNQEKITVLGLGQLGQAAAIALASLGYRVSGWSRSPRQIPGVTCLQDLDQAVDGADVLINLLPLNAQTRGILNQSLLEKTNRGCYLVNGARGGHLVEADLIASLENGQLVGACLDVFEQEPLPPGHAFWSHPQIEITPHIAALTNAAEVAEQLLESYRRVCRGLHPLNVTPL